MPSGGKRPCKNCQERQANRRGGYCDLCVERGLVIEPPKPVPVVLPDLPDETDLQAMEALWSQKGKARSKKQDSFVVLYKASPERFYATLSRLRAGQSTASTGESGPEQCGVPATYDPTQTCPVCRRDPDPITPDLGTERVKELLSEEWALVERFDRHRSAVLAILDERGLT